MHFQSYAKIKQPNQKTISGTIPKPESNLSTVTPRNYAKWQLEDGHNMQTKVEKVTSVLLRPVIMPRDI